MFYNIIADGCVCNFIVTCRYIGCVGGCDDSLRELLNLKDLTRLPSESGKSCFTWNQNYKFSNREDNCCLLCTSKINNATALTVCEGFAYPLISFKIFYIKAAQIHLEEEEEILSLVTEETNAHWSMVKTTLKKPEGVWLNMFQDLYKEKVMLLISPLHLLVRLGNKVIELIHHLQQVQLYINWKYCYCSLRKETMSFP